MAIRRTSTKVDPELRRQLGRSATAAGGGEPVEAVLRLRPATRSSGGAARQGVRDLAEGVVGRAATELGEAPGAWAVNVFPNLGYFVLCGSPRLVERVLEQPEVASASANRRSQP
jgi:hypothetical protein